MQSRAKLLQISGKLCHAYMYDKRLTDVVRGDVLGVLADMLTAVPEVDQRSLLE